MGRSTPDDESHGTHVAGTVGARTNNNIGVAGVAGGDGTEGSGVRLMSCQIFGGKNEGGSGARAMYYSANNGAVISQNSWGYVLKANITAIPQADKAAIDYFIKYAGCDKDGNQLPNSPMKGGIVIFAAGNDGMDYKSYPGAYPPCRRCRFDGSELDSCLLLQPWRLGRYYCPWWRYSFSPR